MNGWIALAAASAGLVVSALLAAWQAARSARSSGLYPWSAGHRMPSLEARIDALQTKMKESANLIEQITAGMHARASTAARLKAEAEHSRQIASIHKDQQDAVMHALRAEVADQNKRTYWQAMRANGLFFIAGVLASVVVQLLVKPL